MIALTSLIAFDFWAVSIAVRVTLKTVFSLTTGASSTAAATGAAAAGAEEGRAMSIMFSFVCWEHTGHVYIISGHLRDNRVKRGHTLRALTRSEASNNVRVEI